MLADAAWTQPVDVAPVTGPIVRFAASSGGHFGWIEGQRTFVRLTLGGKVRRRELKRHWQAAAFDARGRAITVTTVSSSRACRGKRGYRVYIEVRRDGARPQRLGDGCRNIGAPRLAVNERGQAVLAWLEIPSGARKRVVVATGSTTRPMRARWNSGAGDASGHAVAINEDGAAVVAYRRGSRMLARLRRAGQGFGSASDLGATPQAGGPGTAVAIDETGAATVAWTDACACGEAGMTSAPNQLRAARSEASGDFGATQLLDSGGDVPRLPQVAAGRGLSLVSWDTENGADGLTAVATPGAPFGAPATTGAEGGFAAVHDGVPLLVTADRASRWENGGWTREQIGAGQSIPHALVTARDGRLALITQDGDRLRVSYRSG